MIRIEHLNKRYPQANHPILDDISLEIGEGELVTVVGTSGCGKTSFLKTINQLIQQDSGQIWIRNQNTADLDAHILRREIGYVIQKIGLFDHLSIAENIAVVPRILKWSQEKISQRVDELLELVNLDPAIYRNRYPRELSGGQQQRVGIARALAADPDILLMDEPFGAIDAINRLDLQNQLLAIQRKTHKTILFVTHDLSEAFKLGNKILIMDQGKVQQFGSPHEIIQEPANDFVRNFLTNNSSSQVLQFVLARHLMDELPSTEEVHEGVERLSYDTSASTALFYMIKHRQPQVYLYDNDDKIVGSLSLSAFENLEW